MEHREEDRQTILILAPRGRDAAVIVQVLEPVVHHPVICASLADLVARLDDTMALAVLTEESLNEAGAPALHAWIERQPPWSDFPFVVLATKQTGRRSSRAAAALAKLGNEVLLERPLNADTLVSAVNSGLRSRRRQYEARGQLEQQQTVGLENRRLYEAERAARAEAEQANRSKDDFLATLSHELRTPLSAILGWAYVLQQRRAELGDLARGVDTIERNARAQARLIEDLLDMSRIVSGKVALELQTVVPALLLDQTISSVLPSIQAKGIAIEHDQAAAMVPLLGDPQRLQQVIWNLLTNAIKFTEPGGKISVRTRVADGELAIAVVDTGMGIAPDFLPQVFDRFRQADGSTTRSHGGLGLGLAIVKRLVELHGGRVDAFSAGLGTGATFTVRLPIPRESLVHLDSPSASPDDAALDTPLRKTRLDKMRILLVEDDVDGRDMIARLLTASGGEVLAVDSAARAIERISHGGFDAIVSDIGMPAMDGYEMLRRIRAAGNLTPAIALTAFARLEDKEKALSAGYSAHFSKPVEPADLIRAVANMATKHADIRGTVDAIETVPFPSSATTN